MAKCISCGGFNKYFIYIFLSISFKILNDSLYGYNYNDAFEDVKIFNTPTQDYFSWHNLIHQIFGYIGTTIMSIFFYKYELYVSKKEEVGRAPNPFNHNNKKNIEIQLIHNDAEDNIDINSDKSSFIICLLVLFLWITIEQLIDLYYLALKDLDFWMFELLFVTLFTIKIFKIEIFSHQKCAMWFSLVPCLFKMTNIFLSCIEDKEIIDKNLPILYVIKRIYIPIGIVIYMILIIGRAYVNTKIKWFMDLKYISPSKLLIYYGIMGTIICTLVSIISTYIKCDDNNNNEINLYDYICKIPYNGSDINVTSNARYFENFNIYFDTFFGRVNTKYKNEEIIYEIVIIVLGMISFFFYKYFSIKVIQQLTPVYLILSNPILYIFQKIILIVNNYFRQNTFFLKDTNQYIISKFIFDWAGDLFTIIGFLIYLEIIELKFWNYDYNIKANITRRSLIESKEISEPEKSVINDEENQDEESSITFTLA
jgi:hypothetical protein